MGSTVRATMKGFWQQYEPSLESMMLSQNAADIADGERCEILSYLPSFKGKAVLELGAGIGRFTGEIAKTASHVTAVDFIQEYLDRNQEVNGHYDNTDFVLGDVTKLELPMKQYDLIFSNWLLMYLDDEEVQQLALRMLGWLRDDGEVLIRESCYRQSGNLARSSNPTYYRQPCEYVHLVQGERATCGSSSYQFTLQRALTVRTYIQHFGNPFQLVFVFRKRAMSEPEESLQEFLDNHQYSKKGILMYERIFGRTYVSAGGQDTTEEFCQQLRLQPGDVVLDVGCGVGGSAFYMARKYGVSVHGVDLSCNMIQMALENQQQLEPEVRSKVCFELCDITQRDFPAESFDVVYCRDTILHIPDKQQLFNSFYRWLRPGGRLLVTDYCRGDKDHPEEFLQYVAQRGYHLITVDEYGRLLRRTGFKDVVAQDNVQRFIQVLRRELQKFQDQKEDFLKAFSQADYSYIRDDWTRKLARCADGHQVWGLFVAKKI